MSENGDLVDYHSEDSEDSEERDEHVHVFGAEDNDMARHRFVEDSLHNDDMMPAMDHIPSHPDDQVCIGP